MLAVNKLKRAASDSQVGNDSEGLAADSDKSESFREEQAEIEIESEIERVGEEYDRHQAQALSYSPVSSCNYLSEAETDVPRLYAVASFQDVGDGSGFPSG